MSALLELKNKVKKGEDVREMAPVPQVPLYPCAPKDVFSLPLASCVRSAWPLLPLAGHGPSMPAAFTPIIVGSACNGLHLIPELGCRRASSAGALTLPVLWQSIESMLAPEEEGTVGFALAYEVPPCPPPAPLLSLPPSCSSAFLAPAAGAQLLVWGTWPGPTWGTWPDPCACPRDRIAQHWLMWFRAE